MESRTPFLSLQNFSIARERRVILHALSLNFYSGESVCVLGPNGSGKSTLLQALALQGAAHEGTVQLLGKPQWEPEAKARELAYLPQRVDVPLDFTVEEVVRFGRAPYAGAVGASQEQDAAKVELALARWELQQLRARRVEALSGGERQRVHLARIDAQGTRAVILDEPSASLDLRWARDLYERLGEDAGRLFVYATHDLVLGPKRATRILLLREGRLLADGAWAAIESRFEDAYGVPVTTLRLE
jgi:ABC-type cobalamin/Fe3+-siderophores transport system ATPase subunit